MGKSIDSSFTVGKLNLLQISLLYLSLLSCYCTAIQIRFSCFSKWNSTLMQLALGRQRQSFPIIDPKPRMIDCQTEQA